MEPGLQAKGTKNRLVRTGCCLVFSPACSRLLRDGLKKVEPQSRLRSVTVFFSDDIGFRTSAVLSLPLKVWLAVVFIPDLYFPKHKRSQGWYPCSPAGDNCHSHHYPSMELISSFFLQGRQLATLTSGRLAHLAKRCSVQSKCPLRVPALVAYHRILALYYNCSLYSFSPPLCWYM
jgi:hypothetical protein